MPLTGEEIRQRLVAFGEKWSFYQGTERSGAQLFLNELFACYGQDLQSCGALLEEAQHGKFLDLIWPRVCLIEMKRPSQAANLAAHRPQALDYQAHVTRRNLVIHRGTDVEESEAKASLLVAETFCGHVRGHAPTSAKSV